MTLVKYAMYARGEQLHASVWPAWTFQRDHIQFGTRQYAYEGKSFVIVSCGVLNADAVPKRWRGNTSAPGLVADGGSAIIAPDGSYVAEPVYNEETIVYGDIDLRSVALAKREVDVAGHYSRPDVVRLLFDDSPHDPLVNPLTNSELPTAETAPKPKKRRSRAR